MDFNPNGASDATTPDEPMLAPSMNLEQRLFRAVPEPDRG